MEKFKKVPDDLEWSSLHRYEINVNGRQFEVYAHQVMYGFRIRGGWVGDQTVPIDWCCGANNLAIITAQNVLMNLIEKEIPIRSIPGSSLIKPWYKDQEFIKRVDELYEDNIMDIVAKNINDA